MATKLPGQGARDEAASRRGCRINVRATKRGRRLRRNLNHLRHDTPGHGTRSMLDRYHIIGLDALRAAAERASDWLAAQGVLPASRTSHDPSRAMHCR